MLPLRDTGPIANGRSAGSGLRPSRIPGFAAFIAQAAEFTPSNVTLVAREEEGLSSSRETGTAREARGQAGGGRGDGAPNTRNGELGKRYLNFQAVNTLRGLYACPSETPAQIGAAALASHVTARQSFCWALWDPALAQGCHCSLTPYSSTFSAANL